MEVLMKKLGLVIFTLAIFSTAIFAQTKTPLINKTQRNQQARIHQGIKSGGLTKGEVRKLENEQRNIQQDKIVAKSDGKVTAGERYHIKKEQAKAGKDIYRLKRNNRKN